MGSAVNDATAGNGCQPLKVSYCTSYKFLIEIISCLLINITK